MTLFQAVILGLIQGLTEFLPISSSGHLVIAQKLLGFNEPPVIFDILLHVATLGAVLLYFWQSVIHLTKRTLLLLLLATLPAIAVSFLIEPYIEFIFTSLILVSLGFFISAALVFLSDKQKRGSETIATLTPKKTLLIGTFQAIAIIPSISRSGATIYAGLKSGLGRSEAITFAFLISIPAIGGAVVYQFLKLDTRPAIPLIPALFGMAAALTSGVFSLKLLKRMVIQSHLSPFGWYCLSLGILTLLWSLSTL